MFVTACGILFMFGLALNGHDRRMLLLTLAVGAGFFLPAPMDSALQFYIWVTCVEILVAIAALLIKAKASLIVVETSVLLVIAHIMGYALDGSLPFSPYHLIVKLLEVSQIAACLALSPILAPILRNQDATTT